jgi:hypothetical protein
MTSLQHNRFAHGAALSLASAYLTFTTTAAAQDPMDPTLGASAEASTSAETTTETTASAVVPSPTSEEPAPASTAEGSANSATLAPEATSKGASEGLANAEAPAAVTTKTGTSIEREAAVSLIGLESLPGSAYPSAYVRGIKYGSLWRTFHGQQWPYMPQINDAPALRLGISGYLWSDLSNARISPDVSLSQGGINKTNRWVSQTRGIVRITPTYNAGDDWFVQGNAEVVIQGDMSRDIVTGVLANTDDVWVRVGKWNLFDVQVGRYQAWEIANHFGMGLDWATLERQGAWVTTGNVAKPTDGYGLNYFWDRQNFSLGTYAAHLYPTKYLRAELLGHVGQGQTPNVVNAYQMDVRPSAIFDIGILKVKAGWEYGKWEPQDPDTGNKGRDTKNGFGVAAQVVLDPYVDFGGSFARGFQDVSDEFGSPNLAASNTVQTFGGFLNVSPAHEPLVVGFGAFWNHWENLRVDKAVGPHQGKVDTNDQLSMFGAVQYTLWDHLYMKFVLAHASNEVDTFDDGAYVNTSTSGRLRIEYLY